MGGFKDLCQTPRRLQLTCLPKTADLQTHVLCFSPEFPGGCGVPGPCERARRPRAGLPRDQGGQRPHLRLQDRQHRLGQHPLRGQHLVLVQTVLLNPTAML